MKDEFQNTQNWHNRGYLPHYDAGGKYQFITYRLVDSLPQKVLVNIPSLETQNKRVLGTPLSSAANELPNERSLEAPLSRAANEMSNRRNLGAPLSRAAKEKAMERRKFFESHLDKGYGSCLLSERAVAKKVIEAWKYFDKERYDLIAYVVMPNHVHLLIKTYEAWKVGDLVRSWKLSVTNFVMNDLKIKSKFETSLDVLSAAQESGAPKEEECVEAAQESGAPKRSSRKFTIWQREYWDRFIRDENHFNKSVEYIFNNPVKAGLCKAAQNWEWSNVEEYYS